MVCLFFQFLRKSVLFLVAAAAHSFFVLGSIRVLTLTCHIERFQRTGGDLEAIVVDGHVYRAGRVSSIFELQLFLVPLLLSIAVLTLAVDVRGSVGVLALRCHFGILLSLLGSQFIIA